MKYMYHISLSFINFNKSTIIDYIVTCSRYTFTMDSHKLLNLII